MMVLTGVLARLGDAHLAAYGLGTRLDFLLMSFAYGFGAAVLTLVGLATGARQPERVRSYVTRAGAVMVGVARRSGRCSSAGGRRCGSACSRTTRES